jgi:hypothetical protein
MSDGPHRENDRDLETRAFLEAQPAYDAALAKAEAAGGPPDVLNALLSGSPALSGLKLHPLTLGGYLLLQAAGCAYLTGGPVNPRDNTLLILALTEPEWAAGRVSFDSNGQGCFDSKELASKLTGIARQTPVWMMQAVLRYFLRQMRVMNGAEDAMPEDQRPLDLKAAMAMIPTTPALPPLPVTPDGSV